MIQVPFYKARLKAVTRAERAFDRRLISFRKNLIAYVFSEISGDLIVDQGSIVNTSQNLALINKIDRVVESYVKGNAGVTFLRSIVGDIEAVASVNKKYYSAVLGKKDIENTWRAASGYLNSYLGVTDQGMISEGSILMDSISSKQWLRRMKATVVNGVENGLTINELKSGIEKAGERFDVQVKETLPNVFDKAENILGKQVAKEEEMHFAYYQGGIMKRTRDFCEERNNKLFHVSEIALFGTPDDPYGGYTNKSQGEFQGKTDPYDPFTDLGGYNCRHRLFYVSNELGFRLRTDLDPDDVVIPDNWVMAA